MAELSFTQSVLKLKCPRCRRGDLFYKPGFFVYKSMSSMPTNCPNCNIKYEQEPGFFWGAMYISYGIAVFIDMPAFMLLYWALPITFWQAMGLTTLITIILVPFIFRLSRSLWMHLFISYKGADGHTVQ